MIVTLSKGRKISELDYENRKPITEDSDLNLMDNDLFGQGFSKLFARDLMLEAIEKSYPVEKYEVIDDQLALPTY